MCDYSLHSVASRPAKVGDELITTQFPHTITAGFASIGEPNVAVCSVRGAGADKFVPRRAGRFGAAELTRRDREVGKPASAFRRRSPAVAFCC